MHLSRSLAALAFASSTLLVTAATIPSAGRIRETARIRAHFDSVLSELSPDDAARPRALNETQRAHRSALLATLREYRDAGVFPHNYDFPGQAVPYFVDRKTGTLCAVANLLATSGRRDIVDRVARANNNVRVAALAGDTAFTNWLALNGLTLGEAARIQVPYVQPTSNAEVAREVAFGVVAPVSVGISAWTGIVNTRSNADGHNRILTGLGLVSGATAVVSSARVLQMSDAPRWASTTATAAAVLGSLGTITSARSMLKHHSIMMAERENERRKAVASVTPIVVGGAKRQTGVSVSINY